MQQGFAETWLWWGISHIAQEDHLMWCDISSGGWQEIRQVYIRVWFNLVTRRQRNTVESKRVVSKTGMTIELL